jgi:hypothetical protein
VRQADGLQDLGNGIQDAEADSDPELAPADGPELTPEHGHHRGRSDREAHCEEVGRGQHSDDVADQVERRTPDRGDADQQQGRDETSTRWSHRPGAFRPR